MLMLITYDVNTEPGTGGTRRLNRISKVCLDYGMRVQNSVFECEVTPAQFEFLKHELLKIYDAGRDSIRFYHLGKKGRRRVEHHGAKRVPDPVSTPLVY